MRIALVTDAWLPQMNGVVRTLTTIVAELRSRGHRVAVISPDQFGSLPAPSYPEIRLALAGRRAVAKRIDAFAPDAIHIATEGPLGWAARGHCVKRNLPFTTAYHTQFPDYVARRTGLSPELVWPFIRRFHAPAARTMVATATIERELRAQRIGPLHRWGRGVDTTAFGPDHAPPDLFFELPRPIQIYVGRVAVEKNIEAFLGNTHPGSKVVIGDGPARDSLQRRFPEAHFLGRREGDDLAACYAGADVFVFPSRTDTFGLVMIEAMACGTPVAAFPVPGPLDVLSPDSGAMNDRLEDAIAAALRCDRAACHARGTSFTWEASADQFVAGLRTVDPPASRVSVRPAAA
ncbi:glycosyltransferase family 4 protein [Aurantiacibacter spongiae]|uniref:Glycosyltransferase family 1 protein n=1 Tax=Aurantiacibacter spongiae TaxID=2488860 RepID=A0A3N5DI70_9SPHN|nr:glycosyltransferase family 1 protein [Aurantiacibacter spongiae]RPF71362.1 glycosyltransferase family 1 protein [Aurantiacibacter spongiae]